MKNLIEKFNGFLNLIFEQEDQKSGIGKRYKSHI